MVQRAVNAKAKASLRSSIIIRDLDARCPKNHYSSNATLAKVQTQGFNTKESKPEEFRPKELKLAKGKTPTQPRSKFTEPKKTFRTDKKKKYLKKKRDQKSNTLATGNNANAIEDEKMRNNWGNERCYNCQKKRLFFKNCQKPPKN